MSSIRTSLVLGFSLTVMAAHANIVTNGSFESHDAFQNGSWGLYSSIPGWSASQDYIEIGTAPTYGVSGQDGQDVMEMDANHNATVSQTLSGLTGGQVYQLDFLAAQRSGVDASSCLVDVLWNGNLVDEITPSGSVMSNHQYFVSSMAGDNMLTFRGAGKDDSLGGLVDNVRMEAVPEPAPVFALAAGAAVLIRRRKKA